MHPVPAIISIQSTSYTVDEGGGSVEVCAVIDFSATGGLDCDVTVDIFGIDGSEASKKVTTDDGYAWCIMYAFDIV